MMNKAEFIEAIKKTNENYSYGNEILYTMASDTAGLFDPCRLSGTIWVVGRAYAASPQRRSYGKAASGKTYANRSGQMVKRPIWPVLSEEDLPEYYFFDYISKKIDVDFLKDWEPTLKNKYSYSDLSPNCDDYRLLVTSISAVLQFNLNLGKAIMSYDQVPPSDMMTTVCVSNHISFASKLLHFYFPQSVFIIDGYASMGSKGLFNGNEKKHKRYYNKTIDNNQIKEEVFKSFKEAAVTTIYNEITQEVEIKRIIAQYSQMSNSLEAESTSETEQKTDGTKVEGYIRHCIRSYILGKYITEIPSLKLTNQIRFTGGFSLSTMTRLTDSVFLEIKLPLSAKIQQYHQNLRDIWGIELS